MILYLLGKTGPDQIPVYHYEDYLSPEANERMMAENPLNLNVRPNLMINDLALRPSGSTGMHWIPGEGFNLECKWVLQHYELDMIPPGRSTGSGITGLSALR